MSPKRNLFYDVIQTMPFSQAVNYALKPNHGIYSHNDSMLYFVSRKTQFSFDEKIWEEHIVNGVTYLYTKLTKCYIIDYVKSVLQEGG